MIQYYRGQEHYRGCNPEMRVQKSDLYDRLHQGVFRSCSLLFCAVNSCVYLCNLLICVYFFFLSIFDFAARRAQVKQAGILHNKYICLWFFFGMYSFSIMYFAARHVQVEQAEILPSKSIDLFVSWFICPCMYSLKIVHFTARRAQIEQAGILRGQLFFFSLLLSVHSSSFIHFTARHIQVKQADFLTQYIYSFICVFIYLCIYVLSSNYPFHCEACSSQAGMHSQ